MMGAFRQALLLAAAVGAVCAFDIAPVAGAAPAAGEERQQLPMSKTLAMAQDMPDRPPPSAAKEDDEPEAPKEPIGDFQSSPLSSDMMRRSNNNPLNDGAAPDRANGIGQENIDPQTLAPGSVGAVDPLSSDSDSYTLKWARGSEGAGKAGSKAAVTTARPMVEPSSSRKGDASSFRFQRASVATGHKEHVGWQGDMGAMGLATASTPVTPEADLAGAMRPQWNNVAEQPAAAAQAAAPAPVAEPAKAPQPEKKAPFFSPYSPYQYSNGEMHFPVFHGHQLLANQWSTNKKRLVRAGSGLAPPPPAAAAQPTAPPMQPFRFQSLSTRLSSVDHMYPMRGRFQLKGTSPDDAVESKTAAVSSSVRAAFRLKGAAAPPAAAEGERFVRQSVELGHQAAPTPVSAAPASTLADRAASASGWTAPSHQPAGRLMRFMQTGTGMGSGSGSEKKPNHDGPKYNWSPQMPDPNKMQWYQSPAIMYPQTPAMAPAGGAPSTDGADGNFVQTAPTPPAMYLGEAHAGSYPSDLYNAQGLTTPQMSLNLPQAPAPPPKFMEVGAVVGYATPSGVAVSPQQAQQAQQAASAGVARVAPAASATAAPAVSMMQQPVQQQQAQQQVVYQQQQPVQMQQQQQQQQQPVQYMMQQPQQPVQYVMQQPLAGGVVQQPQQPVQYVMMQQPGVQQQPGQPAQMVQQPQQLQPQQPQQPAAGQPAQQPAAGGAAAPGQQPVVINLVLPNGASAGGAAGLAQAAKPQQAAPAAAPLPDDGFPLAHGHMNVAELSTTSVSDRSAVPKAPSMRGAPPV